MKLFNKKIKNILLILLFFLLFLISSIKFYCTTIMNDISSDVFRLHIIANSNSIEDQSLKYIVRDSLISYLNTHINKSFSKNDIILFTKRHINDLNDIVQKVITENGFNYHYDIEIGNYSFPTKCYGDIFFPNGNYDSLNVKIGDSNGHNWWCVMFPPLCFVDISSGIVSDESKNYLKDELSEEEYNILSKSNESSEIKFKIIEIYNNISSKLSS